MLYVLSGGRSGGTLVVTGVAGHTCMVSNGTKTYSKAFGTDKKAVFRGLASGTWTVTMANGTSTTSRTITITSDYALSIAYFSATINITYPANSTCVVKDSNGTQVATNTNSANTAKTFTATVGARGTYTITATSANGSKTKSASVAITADRQSESVTLIYELVLFDNGAYQNIGSFSGAEIIDGNLRMKGSGGSGISEDYKTFITDIKLDLTKYKTLTFSLAEFEIVDDDYPDYRNTRFGVCSNTFGNVRPVVANIAAETTLTIGNNGTNITVTVDISALTGEYYVFVSENIYGHITVLARSIIIT